MCIRDSVLGEPLDNKGAPKTEERAPILGNKISYENQSSETEILETGIKAIDLLCPLPCLLYTSG